jgi:hypothetical protein
MFRSFPAGQSAQKTIRSSQPPEASRLTANLSNGLPSRVLGHLSMREAMSRFSSKFSAVCLFSPTVCLFSGWHNKENNAFEN